MPWFPEFASAAALARSQTRAAGHADPVGQYLAALNEGSAHDLETTWPGEVVIFDPRAGEVSGHRHVRQFVHRNLSWLASLHASTEAVASTVADGRAVVELLAYIDHGGRQLAWPVAVIAESPDDLSGWWPRSRPTATSGHRSVRATPTRAPLSCARSSPGAFQRAAACAWSTAP
jgi:hypothetical protein